MSERSDAAYEKVIAEHVARTVADWPPLTPEQLDRLREMFAESRRVLTPPLP